MSRRLPRPLHEWRRAAQGCNASSMGTFRDDVVVEQIGEGRFKAELDESWNLWPLPQGGIVTSLALRAAGEALGEPGRQVAVQCRPIDLGHLVPG